MSAHRQRGAKVPASGPFPLAGLHLGDRLAIWLATGGGLGYAAKAPGTWGSLPGIAIGIGMQTGLRTQPWLIAFGLVILTALAAWSINRTERVLQVHDDGRIVIDEVVGQSIALAFLPISPVNIIAAFALFRLLDISKPSLIGWIDEKAQGWLGTLGDDVLAGIVAAVILVTVHAYLLP